jgi:hypothetical protein
MERKVDRESFDWNSIRIVNAEAQTISEQLRPRLHARGLRNRAVAEIESLMDGENTMEARFPIQKAGIYLGAVDLGQGRFLPLSPLTLPYSPEFEPRQDPAEGFKTLVEMARISGGVERTAWDGVFNASLLRQREVRDLVIPLALMILLLHLMEIAGRRLYFFAAANTWLGSVRMPKLRLPARRGSTKPVEPVTARHEPATVIPPSKPSNRRCHVRRRERGTVFAEQE